MNRFTGLWAVVGLVGVVGIAQAQQPFPPKDVLPPNGEALKGPVILRLDPELDKIVAPDQKVYVVRGSNEFGITDGNIWVPNGKDGYLLFSDIVSNVIYKWAPGNKDLSVWLNDSGYTGTTTKISQEGYLGRSGPFYIFDFGSNGIAIDPQGRVVFVAQGDKAVVRVEKDGTRTVLSNQFEGKPFNRPNKLAIRADGTIWFSDLNFGTCSNCQQNLAQALYMIKNGQTTRVENAGHGVTLSPDQKVLYTSTTHAVIDNGPNATAGPNAGVIMRYDVADDDTLSNGRIFVDMSGQTAPNKVPGGPDGFTVDSEGNVYSGGPGGTWIIDPQGKHIGTILLPQSSTNVGFGDPDMKTLYLLDRRNLLKIRLKVAGVTPPAGAAYDVTQQMGALPAH